MYVGVNTETRMVKKNVSYVKEREKETGGCLYMFVSNFNLQKVLDPVFEGGELSKRVVKFNQ